MIKAMLYLSILFAAVFPFFASAQNQCVDYYQHEKASFTKENLGKKLYAVHITNFLPKDGFLRTVTKNRARFATTLHFSLGGPVISHFNGNWDNRKYAILVPLKTLEPQLVNIFAQDTFIVGDFKLPKEAILLVPTGEQPPINFPGKIATYDPQTGIIESVKEQLRVEKTMVLESTGVIIGDTTYINGKEIDEKILFKDYLAKDKEVTHQMHYSSIFGILDTGMYELMKNWFYKKIPSKENLARLKYRRLVFSEHLTLVKDQVYQMKIPKDSRKSFLTGVKEFEEFINILDAEIWVQQKYNKSFFALGNDLQNEILSRRQKLADLKHYLSKNITLLEDTELTSPGQELFMSLALRDFKNISYSRFKMLVNNYAKENKDVDTFEVESLILAKAIESLHDDSSLTEEAIQQFEKTIPLTPEWGFARLRSYLGKISDPTIQKFFLRNNSIKELWESKLKQPEML